MQLWGRYYLKIQAIRSTPILTYGYEEYVRLTICLANTILKNLSISLKFMRNYRLFKTVNSFVSRIN